MRSVSDNNLKLNDLVYILKNIRMKDNYQNREQAFSWCILLSCEIEEQLIYMCEKVPTEKKKKKKADDRIYYCLVTRHQIFELLQAIVNYNHLRKERKHHFTPNNDTFLLWKFIFKTNKNFFSKFISNTVDRSPCYPSVVTIYTGSVMAGRVSVPGTLYSSSPRGMPLLASTYTWSFFYKSIHFGDCLFDSNDDFTNLPLITEVYYWHVWWNVIILYNLTVEHTFYFIWIRITLTTFILIQHSDLIKFNP